MIKTTISGNRALSLPPVRVVALNGRSYRAWVHGPGVSPTITDALRQAARDCGREATDDRQAAEARLLTRTLLILLPGLPLEEADSLPRDTALNLLDALGLHIEQGEVR